MGGTSAPPRPVPRKPVIRIVIADDHPFVRDGLKQLLELQADLRVIGEAGDGAEAIEVVRRLLPDVLLLDLAMPGLNGLEVLQRISDLRNAMRTVLLTAAIDTAQIVQAVGLGAKGVLLKTVATASIVDCIRSVANGEYWVEQKSLSQLATTPSQQLPDYGLTLREREIVREIASGSSNRDIARTFGIAEPTVKRHLANIFDKVGVSTRLELAVVAIDRGLAK